MAPISGMADVAPVSSVVASGVAPLPDVAASASGAAAPDVGVAYSDVAQCFWCGCSWCDPCSVAIPVF